MALSRCYQTITNVTSQGEKLEIVFTLDNGHFITGTIYQEGMVMRKGVKGLLMLCVIMITFSIFCLDAKAESEYGIDVINLTQTSAEISFKERIEKELEETVRVTKYEVVVNEFKDSKDGKCVFEYKPQGNYTGDYTQKITGLEPRKMYHVYVSYSMERDGSGMKTLSNTFNTPGSEEAFAIKQAGSTDTSITIDMIDAFNKFDEVLKKRGESTISSSYDMFLGIAKKTGSGDHVKEAKYDAINRSKMMKEKKAYLTITGLEASSHYSICVMLRYKQFTSGFSTIVFFTLDDAYTEAKNNYSNLSFKPKYDSNNGKVDSYYSSKNIINIYPHHVREFTFTSNSEDSLTVDWSKWTESQNIKEIKIGYSLLRSIDRDKDKQEYGSVNNIGPYAREAINMSDKAPLSVANNAKNYTITGLMSGSYYGVVLKCKDSAGKITYYYYGSGLTKGAYDDHRDFMRKHRFTSSYQMPYMYDAKTYREGNSTVFDWTEAINAYLSQDFWKNLNAKPSETKIAYIGYEEAKVSSYDRTEFYKNGLSGSGYSTSVDWTKCITADLCCTKARIFGLDPSKKYAFEVCAPVTYYYRGAEQETVAYFYADETGINYLKLRATGQDRASREYKEKVAVLKNKGVLNVDISSDDFALSGYQAKALVDILMIAGEHNSVLYPVRHGTHYIDGQYYGYDLNGDNEDDIRLFYSDLETPAKCSIRLAKDDDCTVTANNLSYTFDNAAIADIQKKCVENNYTGYYSGINFIFKNPNKVDSKKDDSSSKPSNNESNSSSNEKPGSSSKKDNDDKSSKKDKTDNNDNNDNGSGKTSSSSKQQKKGKKITYKGYKYEIISSNTVRLIAPTKKSVKTVTVPSKIKYAKKNYKVTEIGDSAFKGCKKLQKVTISSNVKTIGKKAFYGCKKLKTVDIKSKNLKKVGKKAFDKTAKNLKISVPKKKLKNYKGLLKKGGVKAGKIKSAKK